MCRLKKQNDYGPNFSLLSFLYSLFLFFFHFHLRFDRIHFIINNNIVLSFLFFPRFYFYLIELFFARFHPLFKFFFGRIFQGPRTTRKRNKRQSLFNLSRFHSCVYWTV
ncbi:hypothetical protein NH340_JMT08773 [Sarcoptes scabiei]|nr:hypothetical protein NH340_JMT08773 [Sarcoptes scabiei]